MVDTKTPGDKTLSVPTKTLTLKPRVETGTVRQSFSHGRTKQVVVEKRGKRRIGGDAPATEAPHAPEPVVAKAAPAKPRRSPAPPRRAAPRGSSGVVLRTLTEDERSARASALADAKVRDIEERRLAEEEAKRRNSKEGIEQAEREAAEARRKAEEERHRQDEEAKRKAELEAKKRFGEAEAKTAAAAAKAAAAPRRARARRRRRHHRRGRRSAPDPPRPRRRRPSRRGAEDHRQAGAAEAARPPDAGHRAQCRRRARALDRLVPPPHPAPEGPPVERAEGKADPRSDDPGSHQHPGTRQPHVRARGRRHPPADEAGRDAQDHRRDRCRHRAADRRGTRPHRQARRRLRRRGRPVRHRRRFHRYRAAFAGRDRDGPRRPRQDLAARRAAPCQRGLRRSRRHHPAYRRLSGDLAGKRQEDHLHRHPGPRRVHRDARARRQGHRHRDPGGRGR